MGLFNPVEATSRTSVRERLHLKNCDRLKLFINKPNLVQTSNMILKKKH